MYDEILHLQRHRLSRLDGRATDDPSMIPNTTGVFSTISRQLRSVQRAVILNLRNQNQINDETLRKLEYELDLLDAQQAAAAQR